MESNPNMDLAQWIFSLSLLKDKPNESGELQSKILAAIKENDMGPMYQYVCQQLCMPVDETLLSSLQQKNSEQLTRLDEKIEDSEKNLGEMEVRESNLAKAEYLCRIGDKEAALTAFRKTYDKTVSLGQRLDIVFHMIRIGLFYMDHDLINRNIDKAKTLIEEGGDWDRRNRLKVYQAVYFMTVRDFKQASPLFLDTISTFTSYELMDYVTFVKCTVLCSTIALPRQELRTKVIKGSEVLEILHNERVVREFVFSLYECRYADFFKALALVEDMLTNDRYFHAHVSYYVREMRIMAYSQLLESYSSLTLQYMATAFGVSVEFIDKELARFICLGRLHAKIDKVSGTVETSRADSRTFQYQCAIKQGDLLLNRTKKLSRIINI